MTKRNFIFDFDSTLLQVESFDELLRYVLRDQAEGQSLIEEFERMTDLSMNGQFSYSETLELRMKGLKITRSDVEVVTRELQSKVSESFLKYQAFFEANADNVYIFSGGFYEIIEPIATQLGFKSENIYANRFLYDHAGNIVDFDRSNLLAQDIGKVAQLQSLNLEGDIIVVGDGYNDYEMKNAGVCDTFFAYTEHVQRENVMNNADAVISELGGLFLTLNIEPPKVSVPQKALLLENVHPAVDALLHRQGFEITRIQGSLSEQELSEKLKGFDVLGIRSKTQVTDKVISNNPQLKAVGAFCIGTNQIDLKACLMQGVAVFNAPYSNTRSVVEMAVGEIIVLLRRLFEASTNMHQGRWNKSAKDCFEVRGKHLGIIGYGNIGSQLSVLAESLGMNVLYYDIEEKLPLGNAKPCQSMQELVEISDIVTVHVDGRPSNKNLIDANAFALMKPGSYLLNLSRGSVVDLPALKDAIESKKIFGAALDVYPSEPKSNQDEFDSLFKGMPEVLLTPHIGGSTQEAQDNIGQFVAGKFIDYIGLGTTVNSVNFPEIGLPAIQGSHRIIHIHENVPGILAKINQVFANEELNVEGQYLKTNDDIGYVITDVEAKNGADFVDELGKIEHTIKVRVLY